MDLPAPLRQAVDAALAGTPLTELARASATLSQRYRAELQDGRFHLADDAAARAYLATRLPATFAAISASLTAVARARPDFAPRTLLDVGAGPGTALWAASQVWDLRAARLLEGSTSIRAWGEVLTASLPLSVTWQTLDVTGGLPEGAPSDVVTLAYVLDELTPAARATLVAQLWSQTADTLLIVEPGTPAGWQRIVEARAQLLAAGAHPVAPCPHAAPCPLSAPDWCHFSQRVARSRVHRQAKGAEVSWEDEKYSYVAVSRSRVALPPGRVLATPRARSGLVTLKLCQADGQLHARSLSKRHGAAFKEARRLEWGDAFEQGE